MDCIVGPEHEWERLDGRPVSAAFHLAEIRQALQFIRSNLPATLDVSEIDAACGDALEALACLTARLAA
ncbi:hypothetical protein [Hyphomonas sp.]|uniref:hypothetical protein n=1 Tax=Hyphomonas sp. TaxID=87 RepID=UPI00391C7BC4